MRYFLTKLLIFLSPFMVLLSLYPVLDPLKVLYSYDQYFPENGNSLANINKDYVSTQNLLQHYNLYKPSNFIFGSSRSIFYETNAWSQYIKVPKDACYHYDAFGESLYGIVNKIEFLNKKHMPVKHALIILDYAVLEGQEMPKEYFRLQDPTVSGNSVLAFQYAHLKTYCNYGFLKDYFRNLFKTTSSSVPDATLLGENKQSYNFVNNEMKFPELEKEINLKGNTYYEERKDIFYLRDTIQKIYGVVIKERQVKQLKRIKEILTTNRAEYRIVISPLYDQLQMNPEDRLLLENLFGKKYVFDFSGINELTRPLSNYYEISHYRPHVADSIMKIIYAR